MTTIHAVWRGDPDAIATVTAALQRAGVTRPTLRAAVAAWQKRHGYDPSGSLTATQLDELLTTPDTTDQETTP